MEHLTCLTESIFKISTAKNFLAHFAFTFRMLCVRIYEQAVFMNLNFVCFIFIVFAQQLGFFGLAVILMYNWNLMSSHVLYIRLVQTYVVHTRTHANFPPRVYTGLFFEVLHCKVYFWFWVTHTWTTEEEEEVVAVLEVVMVTWRQ